MLSRVGPLAVLACSLAIAARAHLTVATDRAEEVRARFLLSTTDDD